MAHPSQEGVGKIPDTVALWRERPFGSLEGVKKLYKYMGFHRRQTKAFQLGFPGFPLSIQIVAFVSLRLAKINLKNKKKQFSFSTSLKIKTLLKKGVHYIWRG